MKMQWSRMLPLAAVLSLAGCTKTPTACPSNEKQNSAGKCVQCLTNADCDAGTCGSDGTCSAPPAGCQTDSDCADGGVLNTTCCSGVCTDTTSDPTANCGGCGNMACATGDSCCSGMCSDTTTDPNNCGSCGNMCGGNVQCSENQCQNKIAIVGLFDAKGNEENPDAGSPTSVEVLEPIAIVERGTIQLSETGFCKGYHFDTSSSTGQALNAGTIGFSGYAGGDDSSTNPVATQIQCAIVDGFYQCGFGALADGGTPGSEPAETPLTPLAGDAGLFGSGATIAFNIAGGSGFGSFSGNQSPYTSYPVTQDLSQVSYTAGTSTTLNLDCSSDTSDCYGIIVAIIEATQNGPANFADPSPTFGYVLCGVPFGDIPFVGNAGPAQLTITGDAISSMLDSDTTLQTAVTTVFTITGPTALSVFESGSLEQMDSEGNTVIPVAATATFGVAPLPQLLPH